MANANIKISANSSSSDRALKELSRQMKIVQSDFKLSSTRAKLFGTDTEKLSVKQNELTSKLKLQDQVVKIIKQNLYNYNKEINMAKIKQSDLQKQIEEVSKAHKESSKATGKNSEESKKLAEKLKELKNEEKQYASAIDDASKKLENERVKLNNAEVAALKNKKALEDLNKSMKDLNFERVNKNLEKFENATGKAADKLAPLAAGFTAAAVGAGTLSIGFEDALAKVSTIAEETEVPMNQMRKAILELSNETGISATEIANNVYDAISAGQSTADAVNFVRESTKLAKSGFAEASQSLDLLTTIMNAYEMEANKVKNINDILIMTQNKGKVTVGELSSSMGKIIPTAKANAVSLENVATGYAIMTAKGIKSAETTTYMNSMMNELGKSGTKASKALNEATGKSFPQLMKEGKTLGDVLKTLTSYAEKNKLSLIDMFGSAEAGKAALTLSTNSGKDFNAMLKEMNKSAGATDEAYKKVAYTTGENLNKAINKSKNSMILFGDAISPIINAASEAINQLAGFISSLSPETQKAIVKAGLFTVALTGTLKITSKLTKGIKNSRKAIKSFADSHPNLINKTKAFGRASLTNIKNLGRNTLALAKNGIAMAKNTATTVIATVKTKASAIATGAKTVAEKGATLATKGLTLAQKGFNMVLNANPIMIVVGLLATMVGAIIYLWNNCEGFRTFVTGMWATIKTAFSGFSEWLTSIFKTDWSKSFGAIGNILNGWLANVKNIFNGAKKIFSGLIDFVTGVFSGDWGKAWEGVKGIFKGIWDTLAGILKSPINLAIGMINGVIDSINSVYIGTPDWDWLPDSVQGKGWSPSIPKFDYLYTGAYFDEPTVLGNYVLGDAFKGTGKQGEFVTPERMLRKLIREESNNSNQNVTIVNKIYTTLDGEIIAKKTSKKVYKLNQINNRRNNRLGVVMNV